jgi:heat shock protein HslJ
MSFPHVCCFLIILAALETGCRRPEPGLSGASNRTTNHVGVPADWAEKRRQGVDFIAVGSNPAKTGALPWQLAIDFSKQMQFHTLDGPELLMPVPKPKPSSRGTGVVLDAQAAPVLASANRRSREGGQRSSVGRNRLSVSIEPITYQDPVTKRNYAYTVRIDANARSYVGGGVFLRSSHRLNGDWTLETFKGQRLRPEQFGDKALPQLHIDLKAGKLSGSTGWSKLKGDIQANGDQLTISPTTNPRQAATLEAGFLDALRQVSLFRVSSNHLTLLINGQYVMTLRKV